MQNLDTSSEIIVEINQAKEYIKQLVALDGLNQSVYLEGPSGIGKSEIVQQIADELGLELIDLRLGNQDIVSLSGIGVPDLEEKTAFFTRPDFFPPEESEEKYLLFLDEFNHASKNVFSAAYQLVLERRMNNHILPKNMLIIAAGNSISDKGIAFSMPSPLVNRFLHMNVKPAAESWLEYADRSGLNWKLQSFIKGNPELLHLFDPQIKEDNFPTPRNWTQCSAYFDIPDEKFRRVLFNGKLGSSTMLKVEQHLRLLRDLPNVELICQGRNPKDIGKDLKSSYSFSLLIKNYVINNMEKLDATSLSNIFTYIDRQENKEVMQVLILELSSILNKNMEDREKLQEFHFMILNTEVQFNNTNFINKIKNFSERMK